MNIMFSYLYTFLINTQNKIEAILFIIGRFMQTDEIAEFCRIGSVGI